MKFSGQNVFYDKIKSHHKTGFTLSVENTVCGTQQGEDQIDPFWGLKKNIFVVFVKNKVLPLYGMYGI